MMVTIKNGIMQIKRYSIPEKIGNSAIACAVPVLERFIAPQENPTAPPNITIETPTIASYPNAFAITSPTAANGIQALELIRKEKTDILITDIRMPGLNGLELIEKVREISPDIKIMIISGYANFEYAQNALKQGVSDYLLKPINKDALNESLTKMVNQIETARRTDMAFQDIQNERREELIKLRNMLLHDLCHDRSLGLSEDILREKYYLNVQPGLYQVLAIKQDAGENDSKEDTIELIWHKMEEILQREITKECYDFVTAIEGEYLYGLMNYPARNSEKIRKIVRSCFNQMIARNDYLGKTQLSLGIGFSVKEAENIKDSFVLANRSLAERLLEGNSKILEADASNGVLYEKKLVDKFTRNLGSALQTLDVEEIRNTINVIYNETMETPGVHGWEILEMIRQCGSIFIMRLDVPDKAELQKEFDNKCDNCVTVNALFTCLLDFMLTKVNQMIALREEDSVRPVRLAKQYIHNHYQEQITLEEVSDYVGLTPAYFSVMFKKETEIGFAKYLINERIEGAKDLLRESTLSVADICRKVGYNDPKHFTRLFEKNVGVKPTVYRKLYG